MPIPAVIGVIPLYSVSPGGSASTLSFNEDIANSIALVTGLKVTLASATQINIYANQGGTGPYIELYKVSNTVTIRPHTNSASSETLSHQSGTVEDGTGPSFYYLKTGNYVLMGVARPSVKQLDVIIDTERNTVGYISEDGTTFCIINQTPSVFLVTLPDVHDSVNSLALAPLVVPLMGEVYDDIFIAHTMRSYAVTQQFVIGDTAYVASGNVYGGPSLGGQFVVKVSAPTEGVTT